MLNPTFTLKLGQQIHSGLATTGKFNNNCPSLVCATTGGKVLIHSPHDTYQAAADGQMNNIRYLNLNKKITALATGALSASNFTTNSDLIFVGSQSSLLAYDIDRNADAFFVDVQDGVNTLAVGKISGHQQPLVVAGGNCSILGFDSKGTEAFWSVTGDNVSSLEICDINNDGQNELLVGSDDFEIRVFKQEEIVGEVTEADRVTLLRSLGNGKFAYGLANGTVGVYSNLKTRQWRVKTKNKATALFSYDLDLDGVPEIFSGWSNGSYNVRREENGEVIFKETMDSPIAAIVSADYRMDGKEEVMICSESGEVRAYLSTDVEFGAMVESGIGKDNVTDQKALNDLQNNKLELIAELKLLEKQLKTTKSGEVQVGSLPMNTNLTYTLEPDVYANAVTLKVEVNTDVQIVNLIAVDLEGIVLIDREVLAIAPRAQSKVAIMPLKPTKYMPCKLRIQTHVATRNLGAQLHVFEADITLPRFSMFKHIDENTLSSNQIPTSKVIFTVRESIDRIVEWIQTGFILSSQQQPLKAVDDKLKAFFVSVCSVGAPSMTNNNGNNNNNGTGTILEAGQVLSIHATKVMESGQSYAKVRIQCDNMDLSSDIIQDLSRHFKIAELESEADFPKEFKEFEEVLKRVADGNAARLRLVADMADDSQRIKALIIRAEDSRLMSDMNIMRRSYTELNGLNTQLCGAYNVRASNHENLLNALKEVNQMIQKSANLRVGKAKARVITDCRAAVKVNNMQSLFRIIRQGFEPNAQMIK